jgi:RNA polymerase sigma-70 factor (ECF subfamily)
MVQSRTAIGSIASQEAGAVQARDDDARLVERVQSGDVAAFDQLILKYRGRVYAIVYNLTGNREDAADLTQEAFIKAFQSISRFKGDSGFFTWLYRIAVNTTLTFLKKSRRRRFFSFEGIQEDAVNPALLEALVSRQKTDKATLLKELQEELNTAFQKLSLKHRTVITLYEIDGLDHDSIAKIMRCSSGTVRSRLHYAKQQLQTYLKPYLE